MIPPKDEGEKKFCRVHIQGGSIVGKKFMVVTTHNERYDKNAECRECGHKYADHNYRKHIDSLIGCDIEGCKCGRFLPSAEEWDEFCEWRKAAELGELEGQ